MTAGDGTEAIAAGMTPPDGSTVLAADIDWWITYALDQIALRTSEVTPVLEGGTGATTATAARTNLDAAKTAHTHTVADITNYPTVTQVALETYTYGKPALDATFNLKANRAGDTISGNWVVQGGLFTPSNSAGGAGTIAYVQTSDGRITRGVSARRYKKNIREIDPAEVGDIFPPLVEYAMKVAYDRSGRRMLGHIADDMVGTPAERFVTWDNDGEVDAYDVIQLLLAQNAQLHARLTVLEARHASPAE